MITTWDEIRITTLQKMFLISGNEMVNDDTTKSYVNAMPSAYNEAVRLLSTVNRYKVKYFDVECDGKSDTLVIELNEAVNDLFQVMPGEIYFKDISGDVGRHHGSMANIGASTLMLDGSLVGTYRIYYKAYPLKVTIQTEGTADLQIDPDVASLVPLYMASQLYKDDDNALATVYRNEFEIGRELLEKERFGIGKYGRIENTTGWWS